MKKSFSSRRAPKRIGASSDSEPEASDTTASVVKRPPLVTKSSKRKSAGARLSFGPSPSAATDSMAGDGAQAAGGDDGVPVFTPKRPAGGLGRMALERHAERSARLAGEERPSYSREMLRELQSSTPSTPSTPRDVGSKANSEEEGETGQNRQVVRIGESRGTVIPTATEILEKKARRLRLAKENEYISMYGDEEWEDDENAPRELMMRPKEDKYGETRLVAEDEDMAEGFDEFVEDGRITLGRKAEKEQQRQRKKEIASLIAQAEGYASDAETDESEAERNAAYDAAQTRAGTYGQAVDKQEKGDRPAVPTEITPVMDLSSVIAEMQARLQAMKEARDQSYRRLADLAAEKKDVEERERWTQEQLRETAKKYEHILEPVASSQALLET